MGVKPEDIERAIAGGNRVLAQLKKVCPVPADSKSSEVLRLTEISKPKKLIRQNPNPLSNRLETEFGNYLHSVNWSGNSIYEQAITVRLANGLRYTPDWVVFGHQGIQCYEVKGKHVWDDSIAKLKMAASKYRDWKWVLVWKEKGSWQQQVVLP